MLHELVVKPQLLRVGIGALVVAYAIRLFINYRRAIASFNYLPGHRALLSHRSHVTRLFPTWRYLSGAEVFEYWNKHEGMSLIHGELVVPANHCTNVKRLKRRVSISFLSLMCGPTTPRPSYSPMLTQSRWESVTPSTCASSDPWSLQEVSLNRPNFPKPTELYESLSLFGRNIVGTEHDEWRKHRKVASPAFSERNNALVFQETTRIVLDLFEMWKEQGKGDMIAIPDMTDVTFELALQVIASAAFGYNMAWKDEGTALEGHKMVCLSFHRVVRSCSGYGRCLMLPFQTFKRALNHVCNDLIPRMICSDRILSMWERGRAIKTGFEELEVWHQIPSMPFILSAP
jgi:hypothetical protein